MQGNATFWCEIFTILYHYKYKISPMFSHSLMEETEQHETWPFEHMGGQPSCLGSMT